MIARARQLGLKVMVGCMTESTVGISAIAQLLPLLDYVDMDGARAAGPGYRPWREGRPGALPVSPGERMRRRTAANICVRNLMTSSTSRLVTALLLFSCVLAWSRTFAAAGQPPADSNRDGQLTEKLDSLVQQHAGQVGMAVKHLTSGYHFEYRATEPMPTASLIKLPVMAVAYRQADQGERQLDAMIQLEETDKVPGSGILTPHFSGTPTVAARRDPLDDCLFRQHGHQPGD